MNIANESANTAPLPSPQPGGKRARPLEDVAVVGDRTARDPSPLDLPGSTEIDFNAELEKNSAVSSKAYAVSLLMQMSEKTRSKYARQYEFLREEFEAKRSRDAIEMRNKPQHLAELNRIKGIQANRCERIDKKLKSAKELYHQHVILQMEDYIKLQCLSTRCVESTMDDMISGIRDPLQSLHKLREYIDHVLLTQTNEICNFDKEHCEKGVPLRGTVERDALDIRAGYLRYHHSQQYQLIIDKIMQAKSAIHLAGQGMLKEIAQNFNLYIA